jgi:histidine triad (HIT) family protein
MTDCIFCKIVAKELPASVVYEDDDVIAINDIHPATPVHVIIIPKKHIVNLADSSDEDLELLGKIQRTAAKLAEKLNISDAFKLHTANGEKAGQTVFHLHYHLNGGYK